MTHGRASRLKGEGGKHLALLLSDQSRVRGVKELLDVRQWASGRGHIYISHDGRQLERTVFDLSCSHPSAWSLRQAQRWMRDWPSAAPPLRRGGTCSRHGAIAFAYAPRT